MITIIPQSGVGEFDCFVDNLIARETYEGKGEVICNDAIISENGVIQENTVLGSYESFKKAKDVVHSISILEKNHVTRDILCIQISKE